nr:hypothetical protein [uncultured Psychroserpens sp.]
MNKKLCLVILLLSSLVYSQDTIKQFDPNNPNKLLTEYVIDNDTQKSNGFFKEYDQNGELKSHAEYKNGLLWNIYLVKDANDTVISDFGTFKNGSGTIKIYKNDKINAVREYEDGLLNGLSIKYYDNGEIAMKGNYHNGKRCGIWYRYNKDGTLKDNGEKSFGEKCPN